MSDYIRIRPRQAGKCKVCGQFIDHNTVCLWDRLNKGLFCQKCAEQADLWGQGVSPTPPTNGKDLLHNAQEVTTTKESLPTISREGAIAIAHQENMQASTALTSAVKDLVEVLKQINYQLTVRP